MSKASMREITGANGHLANTREFQGNSISGTRDFLGYGQLSRELADELAGSIAADNVDYLVYSYATPIAWTKKDGTVRIPNDRYSVTTGKHQSACRVWLKG
jgi:hypothetical protein